MSLESLGDAGVVGVVALFILKEVEITFQYCDLFVNTGIGKVSLFFDGMDIGSYESYVDFI